MSCTTGAYLPGGVVGILRAVDSFQQFHGRLLMVSGRWIPINEGLRMYGLDNVTINHEKKYEIQYQEHDLDYPLSLCTVGSTYCALEEIIALCKLMVPARPLASIYVTLVPDAHFDSHHYQKTPDTCTNRQTATAASETKSSDSFACFTEPDNQQIFEGKPTKQRDTWPHARHGHPRTSPWYSNYGHNQAGSGY